MLCMKATSILVISTRLAISVPIEPPTSRQHPAQADGGRASRARPTIRAAVVSTAIAMPAMPKALPAGRGGWDKPLSAWMKQTEATR